MSVPSEHSLVALPPSSAYVASPPSSARSTTGQHHHRDGRSTREFTAEESHHRSSRPSREKKKMDALCMEFGLPLPQEVYVVPRAFDFSNANLTRFETGIPKGLHRWITDAEFEFTIASINSLFGEADHVGCCMVCCCLCRFLTCNVIRLCKKSKMERTIKKVKLFIHQQNRDVYHPKGFHIVDPGYVGLRHIEIKSISYGPIKYLLDHEVPSRIPSKILM